MGVKTKSRKIQQISNYSLSMAIPPDFCRQEGIVKGSEVYCVIEPDHLKVFKKPRGKWTLN